MTHQQLVDQVVAEMTKEEHLQQEQPTKATQAANTAAEELARLGTLTERDMGETESYLKLLVQEFSEAAADQRAIPLRDQAEKAAADRAAKEMKQANRQAQIPEGAQAQED